MAAGEEGLDAREASSRECGGCGGWSWGWGCDVVVVAGAAFVRLFPRAPVQTPLLPQRGRVVEAPFAHLGQLGAIEPHLPGQTPIEVELLHFDRREVDGFLLAVVVVRFGREGFEPRRGVLAAVRGAGVGVPDEAGGGFVGGGAGVGACGGGRGRAGRRGFLRIGEVLRVEEGHFLGVLLLLLFVVVVVGLDVVSVEVGPLPVVR